MTHNVTNDYDLQHTNQSGMIDWEKFLIDYVSFRV